MSHIQTIDACKAFHSNSICSFLLTLVLYFFHIFLGYPKKHHIIVVVVTRQKNNNICDIRERTNVHTLVVQHAFFFFFIKCKKLKQYSMDLVTVVIDITVNK